MAHYSASLKAVQDLKDDAEALEMMHAGDLRICIGLQDIYNAELRDSEEDPIALAFNGYVGHLFKASVGFETIVLRSIATNEDILLSMDSSLIDWRSTFDNRDIYHSDNIYAVLLKVYFSEENKMFYVYVEEQLSEYLLGRRK